MGKKGLVSIFSRAPSSTSTAAAASSPWPWPPCGTNPQTASFRAGAGEPCCTATAAAGRRGAHAAARGEMYKTVNSVYLEDPAADDFFSLSLACGDDGEEGAAEGRLYLHDDDDDDGSFSTTTASEEWSEAVIRSLGRTSTDRFFFDPPGPLPASNSILATAAAPEPARKALPPAETEEEKTTVTRGVHDDAVKQTQQQQQPTTATSLAERSVAVAVDSGDPYGDFRASMEEMVSAHGLRDWAALEELLAWYLRINGKQQHHLIVGAFVDLLLSLSSSSSSSSPPSSTAAETSTTTATTSSSSTTATTTSVASDAVVITGAAAAAAAVVEHQRGGVNHVAPCSSCYYGAAAGDVQVDVEAAVEGDD
ncbi:transcription repressor OFP13-like [Miscanthus floridulus]|uniref:transcription repressor OFP13-like n=1 Tax=Miscanthus floridulus TaxID=154761 RepID=UPI00345A1CE7